MDVLMQRFFLGSYPELKKLWRKEGRVTHTYMHTRSCARAQTHAHTARRRPLALSSVVCVAPVNADVLSVACIHWSHTHTPLNF